MALSRAIAQDSFAAGLFQGVARHLVPPDGCYDLLNFLLDDEDGSPYKRGGSAYLSASSGRANSLGALAIWDGQTIGGERTVLADYSTSTPGSELTIAAADDTTLAVLQAGTHVITERQVKFAEHDGIVAASSVYYADRVVMYAGSRKTAGYSTGSANPTNGSRTVTGSGTAWVANVDAGMFLEIGGGQWGVVESVESNTSLTLRYPWAGLSGTAVYALSPGFSTLASGRPRACAEFVAGRLCGVALQPNRMVFSGFLSTGVSDFTGFAEGDYHQFPGRILGIHGLRDTAFVFTTAGLFSVSGLGFEKFDDLGNVQHTVEKVDGMVLWSQQGVQAWGNALVVPARDGVYVVDGLSRPVQLSRSVSQLYRSYVDAGYRPGQGAVFRDTYLLPIVDSSSAVQGWLTCRLDGSEDGRFWPWTRLSAGAVRCAAVRNRADQQPKLLGGGSAAGGRLALLSWFDPSAAVKNDADGTTPTWTVDTRDYATGPGNRNHVKKLRARYELVDAGTDDPTFTASYSTGAGFTSIGTAPEDDGTTAKTWLIGPPPRARHVRFRLSSSSAAASFVLRSLEGWVRRSGKD